MGLKVLAKRLRLECLLEFKGKCMSVNLMILPTKCWQRPKTMAEKSPVTQINTSHRGSDIAAAMASTSLVFRPVDSTYSALLLKHSKELFTFADSYRDCYSTSIPQVQECYNSSGYGDELLWVASWLYHATGKEFYLRYVAAEGSFYANRGVPTWFCSDNKLAGTQVLLSRVNFLDQETSKEQKILLSNCIENQQRLLFVGFCPILLQQQLIEQKVISEYQRIGGLIWVSEWKVLQYSVASAFFALVYSDYMLTSGTESLYCDGDLFDPKDLQDFAVTQVDYILGNNPMKMSYLVGYGENFPQHIHHSGASIPKDDESSCGDGFKWLNTTSPNPNVVTGALVGGPFLNVTYDDSRNNTMQCEPTTYNDALLVSLLSGFITSSSVVHSFL